MIYLNKINANKLLASTRLGVDIWFPEVVEDIETKGKDAFEEIANLEFENQEDALRNVGPSCAWIVTGRPLKSVCLYLECFSEDGKVRFGMFGTDAIPAEQIILGDGRKAQIPHVSVRILHDGWRSEIIRAPMGFVCTQSHDLGNATVVYEHRYFPPISTDRSLISKEDTNLIYVGVTKKTWSSRWKEHLQAARAGSPYDFHKAIRHFEGSYHSTHTVLSVSQSWDEAMMWEESFIEERSLRPKGLNMIPGGKAGIAFAAKYGVKANTSKRWENRNVIIRRIQQNAKRRGIPNPAQSLRLTTDPDLMRRMVEARENTFDSNDIAIIHSMFAMNMDWREIAQKLGVKDIYRVRNVVEGRTYKFMQ